jgi:hypothetical protein
MMLQQPITYSADRKRTDPLAGDDENERPYPASFLYYSGFKHLLYPFLRNNIHDQNDYKAENERRVQDLYKYVQYLSVHPNPSDVLSDNGQKHCAFFKTQEQVDEAFEYNNNDNNSDAKTKLLSLADVTIRVRRLSLAYWIQLRIEQVFLRAMEYIKKPFINILDESRKKYLVGKLFPNLRKLSDVYSHMMNAFSVEIGRHTQRIRVEKDQTHHCFNCLSKQSNDDNNDYEIVYDPQKHVYYPDRHTFIPIRGCDHVYCYRDKEQMTEQFIFVMAQL